MQVSATVEVKSWTRSDEQSARGATLDDEELMAGFQQAAEPCLLEELVRRYQGMLFGFLVKLARDRDIAADLCQQTWLKLLELAYSGGYRCDAGMAFRSFLFTIARNLYIDRHIRSSGASRVDSLDLKMLDAALVGRTVPDEVERTVHRRQVSAHLIAALSTLPTAQRTAVEHWAAGDTAGAAARSLAVPRGTFLSRKKYAVVKLRRELEARGIVADCAAICS